MEPRSISDDEIRGMASAMTENINKLARTVDKLLPAMERQTASNLTLAQRNRQKNYVISMLVLLLALAGLFGWRMESQSNCFSNWANSSTDRTKLLSKLSNSRNVALRAQIDAQKDVTDFALAHRANATPKDIVKLFDLLGTDNTKQGDFQKADDAYTEAVGDNPVPTSPKFDCPAF